MKKRNYVFTSPQSIEFVLGLCVVLVRDDDTHESTSSFRRAFAVGCGKVVDSDLPTLCRQLLGADLPVVDPTLERIDRAVKLCGPSRRRVSLRPFDLGTD